MDDALLVSRDEFNRLRSEIVKLLDAHAFIRRLAEAHFNGVEDPELHMDYQHFVREYPNA